MLSDFNTGQFGKDYGLNFADGPLTGLNSRCIVVVNTEGKVVYTEQVAEIVDEPNYEKALASL
jgi:thiol peroxidase